MKHIKYALLGLGALSLVAVFLPFLKVADTSLSLWQLGRIAGELGESATPVYLVMLLSAALAGLSFFAVQRKRLSRPLSGGSLVICLATFVCALMMVGNEGLVKVGSIGALIIVGGMLVGAIASIVALIRPERHAA